MSRVPWYLLKQLVKKCGKGRKQLLWATAISASCLLEDNEIDGYRTLITVALFGWVVCTIALLSRQFVHTIVHIFSFFPDCKYMASH